MKIWHDDIRKAPEGWVWVRTNDEAKDLLMNAPEPVGAISMDHDLGLHDMDPDEYVMMDGELAHASFLAGRSEETGYHLVCWMCDQALVPPNVTIHSWNPVGAIDMAARLNYFGYDCVIKPFDPNERNYD